MASVISAPRIVGLIPARMASTRLPNKPLADIHGWPMIQHVWERAHKTPLLSEVAIATPDDEIVRVDTIPSRAANAGRARPRRR